SGGPANRPGWLVEALLAEQRGEQGDGVAEGALLARGGHHRDLADLLEFLPQRPQAGGVHAVVIRQEDAQRQVRGSEIPSPRHPLILRPAGASLNVSPAAPAKHDERPGRSGGTRLAQGAGAHPPAPAAPPPRT